MILSTFLKIIVNYIMPIFITAMLIFFKTKVIPECFFNFKILKRI